MVVRRTEKREFGLATGWSEEDGTTTTYQPFARNIGNHRRIATGPVPRNVQQRTAAPASLYARRPSGVQPKVATPALDDYEVLELDDLDLSGNPFAARRGAASVSVWNVLGFAALFASVLVGRVIVDAGQSHARSGAKEARPAEAPPPSAAATTGSAGVGPEAQRNAAAIDPDLAARDGSPAPADPGAVPAASAKPSGLTDTANPTAPSASATEPKAPSASTGSAKPVVIAGAEGSTQLGSRNASAPGGNAGSAQQGDNTATAAQSTMKPETPSAAALAGGATDLQPTAADPSSRGRSGATSSARNSQTRESNARRDGTTEPTTTNTRGKSTDGRDSATERATTNARSPANDWRDGPLEPATTNARSPANDWRDGPMEPATTNARGRSNDWRDGPMEPATTNAQVKSNDWRDGPTAPPIAAKAALGTLRINSRPWSQVFIDGRLIGNTPQMSLSLPAGRYTVRLSNPELGMSKTIVVHIAAGELVTRIESLE